MSLLTLRTQFLNRICTQFTEMVNGLFLARNRYISFEMPHVLTQKRENSEWNIFEWYERTPSIVLENNGVVCELIPCMRRAGMVVLL